MQEQQKTTPQHLGKKEGQKRTGYKYIKEVLATYSITQGRWSRVVGLSRSATSRFLGGRELSPQRWQEVLARHETFIQEIEKEREVINTGGTVPLEEEKNNTEVEMLTYEAKRNFNIATDPFFNEVNSRQDLYLSPHHTYIEQALKQTAKVGGFMAIIGESGAGKTVLRRNLIDNINKEELPIQVIQPRTFDKRTLSASGLCEAIIGDVSSEKPKRSLEAKARQVERLLAAGSQAGSSYVLIIEEAHDLPIYIIKYLKRFWELEDGFKKLLSIILIGQPELKEKLNVGKHPEAREVIRRIEVAELTPLQNEQELAEYIGLKLSRINIKAEQVLGGDAYAALFTKLQRQSRSGKVFLNTYPLIINNLVRRAMNEATELGADKVDAEIVNAMGA